VKARLLALAAVEAAVDPAAVVPVPPVPELEVLEAEVAGDEGVGFGTNEIGTVAWSPPESPNDKVQVSPAASCAAVGGQGYKAASAEGLACAFRWALACEALSVVGQVGVSA
jgi:hypothetical protein